MGTVIKESYQDFDINHWNWCQSRNIKIYLKTAGSTYTATVMENGKKKKRAIPYVNICVINDGNNSRFKEEYRQDDEHLSSVINKLYKYYYERGNA